jgi:hypothetical protein
VELIDEGDLSVNRPGVRREKIGPIVGLRAGAHSGKHSGGKKKPQTRGLPDSHALLPAQTILSHQTQAGNAHQATATAS